MIASSGPPDGAIAANAGPAVNAAEAASSERRLRDGILSNTLAAGISMWSVLPTSARTLPQPPPRGKCFGLI
jgi:hypothetical protein